MKLSIVIPVYYNEDNLKPLYEDLKKKVFSVIDYESQKSNNIYSIDF